MSLLGPEDLDEAIAAHELGARLRRGEPFERACRRRGTGAGRRRFGGGGSRTVGLPLTINLAGYEARDATLDANGDIVSIPDKLGTNTITSVGGLGSRADSIADAGVGGELVAAFDGTVAKRITRATWAGGAVSQAITAYFVARHTSGTCMFDAGNGASAWQLSYDGTTDFDFAASTILNTTVTPSAGTWRVWCLVANGASSAVYMNDFVTPVASGNAGSSTLNGLTLGATRIGSGGVTARVFGWYAGTGAHTQAQRKRMARYITQETGLSITI